MMDVLLDDKTSVRAGFEPFYKLSRERGYSSSDGLEIALYLRDGKLLEQMLLAEASDTEAEGMIQVPNLTAAMSTEAAASLVRRLLLTNRELYFRSPSSEMRRIMREVGKETIAQHKVQQWGLIVDQETAELYPAIAAKPSKKSRRGEDYSDSHFRARAENEYIVAIVKKGRIQEAAAIAAKRQGDFEGYSQDGLGAKLLRLPIDGAAEHALNFFRAALDANPQLDLWDAYITLATNMGKGSEPIALLRKKAGAAPVGGVDLENKLLSALLAADEVDAGVALMRKIMARHGTKADGSEAQFEAALQLAKLGALLNRSDLLNEGVRAAEAIAKKERHDHYHSSLASFYLAQGKPRDAERALLEGAAKNLGESYSMGRSSSPLVELAGLYHQHDRHGDVMYLLRSAEWPENDLAKLYKETDLRAVPLGYIAAAALAAEEDRTTAIAILERTLQSINNVDEPYKLLLSLQGEAALPFLDQLAAADRFEERPLIWKGKLLLDLGRLDEAEKTLREAIAIDPSDGEQGPDRRMIVYGVLADVLDAKGDKETAGVYRGAVQAIRLSERADRFLDAGLIKQAAEMYSRALEFFQDAYCIQSRLALQLSAMGRREEAAEHFRKAYQLMPDSFGRIESHCFGCEGVFSAQDAAQIAEEVFTELLQKNPTKPQLHYLMGYLREGQQRPAEAVQHYQQAVRLDPDYLNAWLHLGTALGEAGDPELRNEVMLALIRLDPLGKRAHVNHATDMKRLYDAVDQASTRVPKPSDAPLFTLKSRPKPHTDPYMEGYMSRYSMLDSYTRPTNPGLAIAATPIVRNLLLHTQR
jgi:tetratricopeptide (TPR) repeat protein